MNWLEFFSSVVSSLAWPALVLIVVLILKGPLKGLVPLLQRLKYKDFEVEFQTKLAEAREEAGLEGEVLFEEGGSPHRSQILELAQVSPRSAVIEAWRWVELASAEVAEATLGDQYGKAMPAYRVVKALAGKGKVDQASLALFNDLRVLRNRAVHAPEFAVSVGSALDYARLANRLAEQLKAIREFRASNEHSSGGEAQFRQ